MEIYKIIKKLETFNPNLPVFLYSKETDNLFFEGNDFPENTVCYKKMHSIFSGEQFSGTYECLYNNSPSSYPSFYSKEEIQEMIDTYSISCFKQIPATSDFDYNDCYYLAFNQIINIETKPNHALSVKDTISFLKQFYQEGYAFTTIKDSTFSDYDYTTYDEEEDGFISDVTLETIYDLYYGEGFSAYSYDLPTSVEQFEDIKQISFVRLHLSPPSKVLNKKVHDFIEFDDSKLEDIKYPSKSEESKDLDYIAKGYDINEFNKEGHDQKTCGDCFCLFRSQCPKKLDKKENSLSLCQKISKIIDIIKS